MKTDLINIGSSLGLDKLPSLSSFGGLIDGASKLQGFLIESEKTEQIKAQANAFTHHSDNQKEIALRSFDSEDLKVKAQMRLNDQTCEKEMLLIHTQANKNVMIAQTANKLIDLGETEKGYELIKSLINKEIQ